MTFDRIVKALLIFVPIAILADFVFHLDPVIVFILSALAVMPLADLIGEATEELAIYTGPRVGGLLNATLGNAAELIITIFALREGLVDLVRASITGSILGNLLLVLGLSILLGGLKNGIQVFDRRTAGLNATMTMLAVVALSIPSLFDAALQQDLAAELGLSEGVAIVMIVLYGLSILYAFTQRAEVAHEPLPNGDGHTAASHTKAGAIVREPAVEEAHTPKWSMRTAVIILVLSTLGIVIMSEVLVGAVEPFAESFGLSEFFIGIIIIPLVGNVAEHLVAVQVAIKNKMELSLAVSLGSSLQIALFVAPVLVFISLLFPEKLLLVFNSFELIALMGASVVGAFVALDGESNWLEGAMLLGVYIMTGLAFFFLPHG